MTPRYASKTDRNHAAIRDGLRALGYDAIDTFRLGDGKPDLVVITVPTWTDVPTMSWWEIKADGGDLTAKEREWHEAHGCFCVGVARCVEDILKWYGFIE